MWGPPYSRPVPSGNFALKEAVQIPMKSQMAFIRSFAKKQWYFFRGMYFLANGSKDESSVRVLLAIQTSDTLSFCRNTQIQILEQHEAHCTHSEQRNILCSDVCLQC